MQRTTWYRWNWCLYGGRTLALCAAVICFTHGSTAWAQCMSGGSAAATTGATALTTGGVTPLGAQVQAFQQMALQAQMQAQMQAQLEAMRARQQFAAQQRELAARQREDASGERRLEFASLVGDRTACSRSTRDSSTRATFAEQAERTTARERQVARLLDRERERQAALQERIDDRDAEMAARRQKMLAQR